jgi:hypothetical protein
MRAEENRLMLSYRFRRNDEDWQDVDEPISVVRVPCRYGGSRPYFVCPGVINNVPCRRRVAKLYGPGRYFLCRHCYRLGYASQSEDAMDRTLRRANTIRRRLGGEAGMLEIFPARPKGMWHSTYERLRHRVLQTEFAANMAFEERAAVIMARVEQSPRQRSFWQ